MSTGSYSGSSGGDLRASGISHFGVDADGLRVVEGGMITSECHALR